MRTATAVWRITPEIVAALADRLGEPLDSYLNGTQTWLTDDGPGDATIEWRLHPVGGYRVPAGTSHYDVWDAVVASLPGPVRFPEEERGLDEIWGGLECFAPHERDLEPAPLAHTAAERLGVAPDASGLVDHTQIGDEWERSQGSVSIVDALFTALHS